MQHRFTRILILFSLVFYSLNTAKAHGGSCACSSVRASGLAGPIITLPAYTLPKGTFSIGAGLNYFNAGRLSSNQINRVINRGGDEHADDFNSSLTPSLAVAYGLTDDLSLSLSMPFVLNYDYREVHDGELEQLGNSIGFGDLNLLAQYRFLKSEKHQFESALLGGIKFPTGKTNVISDTGERFETINQPGSGSYDPLFGIAFSKVFSNQINLDANFLYKLTTEGAQNTDVGDAASYNVAISYPIHHEHINPFEHRHLHGSGHDKLKFLEKVFPEHLLGSHLAWDLIFEVNTVWEGAPEVNGVKEANHGGTTVMLSPGIRATVNNKWVYNLSVGFPVIESLEGEQGGSDLQVFMGLGTSF